MWVRIHHISVAAKTTIIQSLALWREYRQACENNESSLILFGRSLTIIFLCNGGSKKFFLRNKRSRLFMNKPVNSTPWKDNSNDFNQVWVQPLFLCFNNDKDMRSVSTANNHFAIIWCFRLLEFSNFLILNFRYSCKQIIHRRDISIQCFFDVGKKVFGQQVHTW